MLVGGGVLTVLGVAFTVLTLARYRHLQIRAGLRPPRLDVRQMGISDDR